jgi:hypothetical protein
MVSQGYFNGPYRQLVIEAHEPSLKDAGEDPGRKLLSVFENGDNHLIDAGMDVGADMDGPHSGHFQPSQPRVHSRKARITCLTPDEKAAERYRVELAGAKLVGGLHFMDKCEAVGVEKGSIYGAVILAPQLARTLGWPRELTALSIVSYIFLAVCVAIHAWLLTFIDKEERVMDKFSGQMYLCDFGAFMDSCSNDGSCVGPGGTKTTPPRLYGWNQWALRNYVRDSMLAVFPDMASQIGNQVDPGEYGVESYSCRLLCCIVFITSILPELKLCYQMARLLWFIPSENQPWIALNQEEHDRSQEDGNASWFESVKLKVAGMSRAWKIVNFVLVLLPKSILVFFTAKAGTGFLMETAGVDDIIVNSVALGFLLGLDDLTTSALMSADTVKLLEMCEDLELDDEDQSLSEAQLWKSLAVDRDLHLFGAGQGC